MKLCVVIPAYNAAPHIEAVLERVAALTSCGLAQVVVVDDGSRDETVRRARRHQPVGYRVDVLERERNGGYGAAMKDGLAAARAHDPEQRWWRVFTPTDSTLRKRCRR
jgi:glycosyltransferase involved in cell wall biosynthesis